MRRDANFSNVITEILRKSKKREERDMMCQREKKKKRIVAIPLSKLGERKYLQLWKFNNNNKRNFWQPCCQNLKIGKRKKN